LRTAQQAKYNTAHGHGLLNVNMDRSKYRCSRANHLTRKKIGLITTKIFAFFQSKI
jgi:hypothetical protein